MGAFYGNKIKNGEINPKTEAGWKLADVPSLWRKRTEDWLKANQDIISHDH